MVPQGLELKNEMAYLLIHARTELVELLNREASVVLHHSVALLDQVHRYKRLPDQNLSFLPIRLCGRWDLLFSVIVFAIVHSPK